jgi:hypothetical protein
VSTEDPFAKQTSLPNCWVSERVRGFSGSTKEFARVSCSPYFVGSLEDVGRDCIGDRSYVQYCVLTDVRSTDLAI